jgi:hypothetical protein
MSYRINSSHSILNDSKVADIRMMALRGETTSQIARTTGVHRKTVYNILEGNTWAHVPTPVRAYGYPDYLVFPDGRVYSSTSDQFIAASQRSNGSPVVRIKNSGGKRVTTPVSTLIARGYHGTRAHKPQVTYVDGNPANTHFTNITL